MQPGLGTTALDFRIGAASPGSLPNPHHAIKPIPLFPAPAIPGYVLKFPDETQSRVNK